MFSWSGSNGNGARRSSSTQYPGRRQPQEVTPIEGSIRGPLSGYTRAQHLKSYVEDDALKRSTKRVSSDDTTYDTVFQTTQGDTLILRVNVPLASSFSTFCPAMMLAGVRVRHPWVEPQRMRVTGYDPIQSEQYWDESGMTLGAAVHDVVKYFQMNPPQVLEFTDPVLASIQAPKRGGAQSNGHGRSPNVSDHTPTTHSDAPPSYDAFESNNVPAPNVPLPTIPTTFPLIEAMQRDELDEMIENEPAFASLVKLVPVYDEIQTTRLSKVSENIQIAEENLTKETHLKELHAEVTALQLELQEKVATFQKYEAQQNDICAPPDRRGILKRINRAKKEAFEQSEELAEDWVEDGAPSVDNFVKTFVELRKTHHTRGAKMEILQNSMQDI